jgi:hypothetical protein
MTYRIFGRLLFPPSHVSPRRSLAVFTWRGLEGEAYVLAVAIPARTKFEKRMVGTWTSPHFLLYHTQRKRRKSSSFYEILCLVRNLDT